MCAREPRGKLTSSETRAFGARTSSEGSGACQWARPCRASGAPPTRTEQDTCSITSPCARTCVRTTLPRTTSSFRRTLPSARARAPVRRDRRVARRRTRPSRREGLGGAGSTALSSAMPRAARTRRADRGVAAARAGDGGRRRAADRVARRGGGIGRRKGSSGHISTRRELGHRAWGDGARGVGAERDTVGLGAGRRSGTPCLPPALARRCVERLVAAHAECAA